MTTNTNSNNQATKLHIEKTMNLFHKIAVDPDNKLWYRNSIVEINLRLVAHVLKKYKPYTDDQYQAGCMGLIIAVDNFNDAIGVPFHNFACFCIEREIHKQHRVQKTFIENIFAENMVYLDSSTMLKNGDEVDYNDIIPDTLSEEDFNNVLDEYDLSNLFSQFIVPCVEMIAGKTKGQETKVDINEWKNLELRYILELANIESQKVRFNLSQMAKSLGLSVQNVRNRHARVIETVKVMLKESGYNVD